MNEKKGNLSIFSFSCSIDSENLNLKLIFLILQSMKSIETMIGSIRISILLENFFLRTGQGRGGRVFENDGETNRRWCFALLTRCRWWDWWAWPKTPTRRSRGTKWERGPAAGRRRPPPCWPPCWPPRVRPPAAVSTCSSGFGTKFSPNGR